MEYSIKLKIIVCIMLFFIIILSFLSSDLETSPDTTIQISNTSVDLKINNTMYVYSETNSSKTHIPEIKISKREKYLYLIKSKGILQDPTAYREEGDCELIAKQYQKEYGGYMVLYVPYINEQPLQGNIAAAWGNKVVVNGIDIYVDYQTQTIFYDTNFTAKQNVLDFYTTILSQKHQQSITVKMFVYGVDEIPFPIIWNFKDI